MRDYLPACRLILVNDQIMIDPTPPVWSRYERVHDGRSSPYANALACRRPHWLAKLPDDIQ